VPLPVPADLEEALAVSPAARDAFNALPPERKDAWISWVDGRRGPGRRRRIQYAVGRLGGYRGAAAAETVEQPLYPVPPEREWWPWVLLALLVLAGIAALLIWLFAFRNHHHHTNTVVTQKTTVPLVIGQKQQAAVAALRRAKLGAVVLETHTKQPKDTVVRQDPGADTQVAAGTKVRLTVSSGPLAVAVPNTVGLSAADAIKKLQAKNFTPHIVQVVSKKAPGTVVTQKPAAGASARPDATVTLGVSKGGAKVTVPNVVGQTEAAAVTAIHGQGLDATVALVSSSKPRQTVVAQSPAAGAKVDQGTAVRINVSKGQAATTTVTTTRTTTTTTTGATTTTAAPGTVAVPSLVGQKLASALGALERVNLRASLKYLSSQKPVGTVIGQSPAAGRKVPPLTRVQVNAAEGPNPGNPAQVPSVTGEDQQTATSDLQSAGFQVVVVQRRTSSAQSGSVVEQQPASGTTLATGDFVAIYVAHP
jgi:beta-lactam-binding protein with PASTA domain